MSYTPFGFITPRGSTTVTGLDPTQTSHTILQDIGTNTHVQIDSHIGSTAAHGATGAVVGTTNAQTLTNKTLTAPIISTISNTGTLTLPTATTTLTGRDTTDTLTNKTMNSAANTITVTSGSLSADNINNILDQRVKTTNNVTFAFVTSQRIQITGTTSDALAVRSTTPSVNQIIFQDGSITSQTGFGYDNLNSLHRCWGYLNSPFVFATNDLERMRIPAGGIANDNSITQILGLNGTTLAYKNNVVDTSTSQSLTNKDFTNGVSQFGGKTITSHGSTTTTDGSTVTLITIPTSSNTSTVLEITLAAFCTAGANVNTGCGQVLRIKALNVAGALTFATINNVNQNTFASGLAAVASGSNVLVQIAGIASNTINWAATCVTNYM